ncbi:hypothetical protein EMIHUDRAFT_470635 [Emiliania huxleyi CCMP1516]|uniref:DnaJ homologue subfamily C GRV2/DNAJC13 N-terminal domain-containing protein n=2 Tax=Emiliania huxleyi TaxID=2903 RepID=A0A0D3ISK7_EMIH1|nr:hypothetical protein EMIHUDRAFT_470635 [Emiliania huxleyi CCMP1516]EOD14242.1 hypothetical protein EMIHUDRAFT_470635 [Emiliania huxleyi CCMP1516]|eukprot:XP_005766671.1 hypothetical protein EMIHUDRAFT_470635 [Emiliania huxleyi CCMP1516]
MLDRADTSAAPVQYRHATALVQRDAERRAAVAEAAHMVRQSKWSDRSEVQEFVAVKQGNALRGSYMRIIEIGPRGICTLDPSTRRLTNRWPLTRVVRVTADDQCGVDLLLSEPVGGLFCLPLAVERRVSFALATPGESAQLLETIRAQRVVVQALQCFEQRSLIRESPDEEREQHKPLHVSAVQGERQAGRASGLPPKFSSTSACAITGSPLETEGPGELVAVLQAWTAVAAPSEDGRDRGSGAVDGGQGTFARS